MRFKTCYFVMIFFSLVIFLSCYKDINLDKYKTDPLLVLNCVISPDTVIMASVTKTWFITEEEPKITVNDAEVELYLNGIFKENMSWMDTEHPNGGIYLSSVRPFCGDRIKIIATAGKEVIYAEDIVPPSVQIEGVHISKQDYGKKMILINQDGESVELYDKVEIKYEITFQDDPDEDNFYFVRIETCDPLQSLGYLDYSSDPVFILDESVLNGLSDGQSLSGAGGRTFSDQNIKGLKYTLSITESAPTGMYTYGKVNNRRIILYSLSAPYYKYLTSILKKTDEDVLLNLSEWGLSEPLGVYSNVINGKGIIGACQYDFTVIDLRDIIPPVYW